MAPNYIFGSMTAADLPLIRRWLTLPHVLEWWGDPREQYDLVSATSMSRRWINISFRRPAIPSATFNVMISPSGTQALVRNLLGTRGIDLFIGEPDMIGHGHGPILIRRFVDNLLQKGLPRVVTER